MQITKEQQHQLLKKCDLITGNLRSIADDELKDKTPIGYWSAIHSAHEIATVLHNLDRDGKVTELR